MWKMDDVDSENHDISRDILAFVTSQVVAASENASITMSEREQLIASGIQLAVSDPTLVKSL